MSRIEHSKEQSTALETRRAARSAFTEGMLDCVPTLLGYISIGFACGIVANSAQLSIMEIGLMSALVYAGSAQFIMCAMLISMSPPSAIVLTTFLVNLRHVLMSATLAPHFTKYSLMNNIGIGTLLTDESFGVATNRLAMGLQLNDRWMHGLNLSAYLTWVASCVMGGWLGGWISSPEAYGLDFALTAMFTALLILQLHAMPRSKLKHYTLLMIYTIVSMLVLSNFLSTYMAVLISTILVATIGVLTEK